MMIAAAVMMMSCGQKTDADPSSESVVIDTIPQLVMQIQQCSRLYTTEVKVHKIVTHDDVVRLKGKVMNQPFNIPLPLGDRKIAIPMDATLKAYIDFSEFDEKSVERDGDRITILLPDPQVVLTSSGNQGVCRTGTLALQRQRAQQLRTAGPSSHSQRHPRYEHHRDSPSQCRPRTGSPDCADGLSGGEYHHCVPQESDYQRHYQANDRKVRR